MKAVEQSQARQLYAQGYSRPEIAVRLGASRSSVYGWTANMTPSKKNCGFCGKEFQPKRTTAQYCSPQCKKKQQYEPRKVPMPSVRQCKRCKNEFEPTNPKQVYCSAQCKTKHWHQENYIKKRKPKPATAPKPLPVPKRSKPVARPKKNNETKPQAPAVPNKRLTINLPPDVHRAFKTKCTAQGLEMTEVVTGFIDKYLNGSPSNTDVG